MANSIARSTKGRCVAVLGAGVLGRRIACCWVAGGFDVNIRDPSAEQREAALQYVLANANTYGLTNGKTPGQIQVFEELAPAVSNAWMVIEAVPEKLQLKIDTFKQLEETAPDDTILCSNSSSYKSSEMLSKLQKPRTASRILNTHYMMPPHNIIVELMTDGHTSQEVFPIVFDNLQEIGMHPIIARKESTGFVFNRVWAAIKRECLTILSEGVSKPKELDGVWVEMFGHNPQGPCGMMDDVGLDTVAFIEEHYVKERGLPSKDTVDFLKRYYIAQGRLGSKSDKGGLYEPGDHADDSKQDVTIYFLDIGLSNSPDEAFNKGRVLVGHPDGHQVDTLVDGQHLPDGLAVSTKTDRLYWTSMGVPSQDDGSIWSCKRDGSDVRIILAKGTVHTPKQLCIDDHNGKIYFSDREGMRVMRCNLDGSASETLIQVGDRTQKWEQMDQSRWCVGICVALTEGKFYWTQKGPSKGNQGRIFRANINFPSGCTYHDRTDVECLYEDLPEPIDLAIDENAGLLYWTDRGEIPRGNSLNRASLRVIASSPSKHDFEILTRNLHEAIGLHIDKANEQIYTTDLGGCVYVYDIKGKKIKKIYEGQGAFSGITVLNK